MEFKILPADRFHDQVTGCCTGHNDHTTQRQQSIESNSSGNLLDELNDDCLRSVFKIYIQNGQDYYKLANVCERFREIATEVYSLKMKRKTFAFHELTENNNLPLSKLDHFLTTFGRSVNSAYLNFNSLRFENVPNAENVVFEMIKNQCKNLQTLHIRIENNSINWMELRSILPVLKCLRIDMQNDLSTVDFLPDFISTCCSLETLVIQCGFEFELNLPEITFPKLRKFKLPNFDYPRLDKFLMHNPQIEHLKCEGYSHNKFIVSHMPNLKKLTLHGRIASKVDILDLRHLEANVKVKLENLFVDGRETESVCKMKNVTTLSLDIWSPFGANNLVEFAKVHRGLRKLKLEISDQDIESPIELIKPMLRYVDQLAEIEILHRTPKCVNRFDQYDFEEILKILECRNNSVTLNIHMTDTINLIGTWMREKVMYFQDESNRLNVVSHSSMPRRFY